MFVRELCNVNTVSVGKIAELGSLFIQQEAERKYRKSSVMC